MQVIEQLRYALKNNFINTSGGSAVLSGLTKDMGIEYAAMLMTAVIGTYTCIGGLGATFYVSFFNTAMIMMMMLVFVIRVYDDSGNDNSNPLGRYYQNIHLFKTLW
jgi:Na+/proline symporter